jgi:hypothetical protein
MTTTTTTREREREREVSRLLNMTKQTRTKKGGVKLGVLWESYRPTSSNHRRRRIYPLSYSFLSSFPFLLLLFQCFISFRQSAKGYKVFTFHTISTRVERDEKQASITLPSFWNKKKKLLQQSFSFFLPSYIWFATG